MGRAGWHEVGDLVECDSCRATRVSNPESRESISFMLMHEESCRPVQATTEKAKHWLPPPVEKAYIGADGYWWAPTSAGIKPIDVNGGPRSLIAAGPTYSLRCKPCGLVKHFTNMNQRNTELWNHEAVCVATIELRRAERQQRIRDCYESGPGIAPLTLANPFEPEPLAWLDEDLLCEDA